MGNLFIWKRSSLMVMSLFYGALCLVTYKCFGVFGLIGALIVLKALKNSSTRGVLTKVIIYLGGAMQIVNSVYALFNNGSSLLLNSKSGSFINGDSSTLVTFIGALITIVYWCNVWRLLVAKNLKEHDKSDQTEKTSTEIKYGPILTLKDDLNKNE